MSGIKQTNKGNIKHNSFQILQGHVLAYVAEFKKYISRVEKLKFVL